MWPPLLLKDSFLPDPFNFGAAAAKLKGGTAGQPVLLYIGNRNI